MTTAFTTHFPGVRAQLLASKFRGGMCELVNRTDVPPKIAVESGQVAAAKKTITTLVTGLQSTLGTIANEVSSEETVLQLNTALLTRGIETGWATFDYNGEDVSIQLAELAQWLSNPISYVARLYSVPDEMLVRWLTTSHDESINSVDVQCRHNGCRVKKEVTYESITQMFAAEICAKDEYYVCRRHAVSAWECDKKINDSLVKVLFTIQRKPESHRSDLHVKKADLVFLELLCLIEAKPSTAGREASPQYFITQAGQQYLANQKEQVTFVNKVLSRL